MTKLDLHEFDLRYGGRVLAFHGYMNTDRDPKELVTLVQRAARGGQLDAVGCWFEGYPDGAEAWKAMLEERKVTNDDVLRYGGRLFVFHAYLNTDRDHYHVQKALLRIARGPRLDACVVWCELYEGEDGRKVWGLIQEVAKRTSLKRVSSP